MKFIKWVLAAAAALTQCAALAGLPGPLLTPQWLHDHLGEVTLVDVRDDVKSLYVEPKFEVDKKTGKKDLVEVGGYIAGALSVDFGKIREERTVDGVKIKAQMPTAEHFTKVMGDAGLTQDGKPIVIVSTGDSVDAMDMATRLYFQLRYFGEPRERLAVLNGGVSAWLQSGYAVTTAKLAPTRGNWAAGTPDRAILATLVDVQQGLQSGEQFVDARPTAQYLGIVKKPVNKTAGHLAGARSFPTEAIVQPVGAAVQFMSADAYRHIFAQYDIQPDAPTVAYCNTGHLASGAWFVSHEILGNQKARLYAGSMTEWTNLGHPTVALPQ